MGFAYGTWAGSWGVSPRAAPIPITKPMIHSPANVLRWLLVSLGIGADPTVQPVGLWPIYYDSEVNTPDQVITVYDTTAKLDGRGMISGDVWKHDGFQIRFRAGDSDHGYAKAEATRILLNEGVQAASVTVSWPLNLGQATYTVFSINRLSAVIRLGKEKPVGKRSLFTLNGMMSVYRVA